MAIRDLFLAERNCLNASTEFLMPSKAQFCCSLIAFEDRNVQSHFRATSAKNRKFIPRFVLVNFLFFGSRSDKCE